MNKLKVTLTGLFAMCLSIGVMNAQSGTNMPPAKAATATKQVAPAKAKTATTSTKAAAAKPATTQHLKKDGTPDMRYKENKAAAGKTATKKATRTKTPAKPTTQPATPASK